ncbi:MAG: Rieske (2Fe-2S) protein [Halorientalis sp.]
MDEDRRIAAVESVPEDSTFLFRVRDRESDEEEEAILVRVDGEVERSGERRGDGGENHAGEPTPAVAGWLNQCQHFTHIALDKGSGAAVRDGEILCTNHGAYFAEDTGLCTHGPCEGAYLQSVTVTVREDHVYLADDDYALAGVGPGEQDDLDLASTSNVEF